MAIQDPLTEPIIGSCFRVANELGPGFLEKVYENAIRANITVPKGVLERIDRYAKAHGQNRSAFMVQAARQAMLRGA